MLVAPFINKTMMVILLSLIFIGQSTASMMMFYSMTSNMANMQSIAEPDNTTHNMNNVSQTPSCHQDETTVATINISNDKMPNDPIDMASEDCFAQ